MSALQGKLILGNIDVTSLFLGNNEVSAVYIGNLQIWPDNSEPDESTLFTETNSEGIEYPYVNEITQKYIDVDELIHYDTTDCLKPDKQSGDVSWYLKTETDGENGGLIQINNS